MAELQLGGKVIATQSGANNPVMASNVVMDNVNLANVNMDNVNINNALASATFPAGHIVQVQSVVDNSTSGSINVTNWTLQPNMSLTVTPKFDNSYFFLVGRCSGENNNDEHRLHLSFFRDGNRINPGQDVGSIVGTMFVGYSAYHAGNDNSTPVSYSFQTLDKTAGTIAGTSILFQIKLKEQNSISTTWYYNRTVNSDTTSGSYERLSSELIVMEVKQ